MHHPASGFAVVGVAANLTLDANGNCARASLGITGISSKAYRPAAVESLLSGAMLTEQMITSIAAHASDGVDINGDLFASADYRRHLAAVYTKRAIQTAMKSVPSA
jgi:carbon-monoxide dehydrogenase medium subunit